ncbi:MAG TPA: hypothetical protein VKV23_04640 [Acidimicrobiales bacterium]|nr:hypothetical protein [Acidimicrobiales bacterium]
MRRILMATAGALLLGALAPASALASPPTHPSGPPTSATSRHSTRGSHGHPSVLFVLRGTLGAYTPASSSADGSVSITVAASNFGRATLRGQTLVIPTTTKTRVVLHDRAPITAGDRGIVKVRAPKDADVAALEASSALEVIDQGHGSAGSGSPPASKGSQGTRGKPTAAPSPSVLFVLRGTLGAYTPASSSADGSVSITVAASNFGRATLRGQTLVIPTTTKTRVVLHDRAPITAGDRGIVKVRAPKDADVAALEASSAFEVIDQGHAS